jgi:DNA processing protein
MQLTDAQRLDWLRLIRTEGVGPRSFRRLINRFGGAAAALDALPDLTARQGRRITPPTRSEAEDEIAALVRLGGRLIATGEADYPRLLTQVDAAPPLLALRGAPILNRPAAALVGSRNASTAGLAFTERRAASITMVP